MKINITKVVSYILLAILVLEAFIVTARPAKRRRSIDLIDLIENGNIHLNDDSEDTVEEIGTRKIDKRPEAIPEAYPNSESGRNGRIRRNAFYMMGSVRDLCQMDPETCEHGVLVVKVQRPWPRHGAVAQ